MTDFNAYITTTHKAAMEALDNFRGKVKKNRTMMTVSGDDYTISFIHVTKENRNKIMGYRFADIFYADDVSEDDRQFINAHCSRKPRD